MNKLELWNRYQQYLCTAPGLGLALDISRMNFDDAYLDTVREPMSRALAAMSRLEAGEKANIDEDRLVGHYWLRDSSLAPDADIRRDIDRAVTAVDDFAAGIHGCSIHPPKSDSFDLLLCIGIGGSSLGPQLLADALGGLDDMMLVRFIDNTDPDGIARTLAEIEDSLERTLTLVTSKSGTTTETRNGMLEAAAAYQRRGLSFPRHAVAITQEGSELHRQAAAEHWLATFPMWDWVGGRTSVLSVAGLLPAALLGFDTTALLRGARACDVATREPDMMKNPAALLALMWYYAGNGRGDRNMIALPYADRLALLGRYLQQLVMESIGKERDRKGNIVHQGLTVLGNKGSTDQHSFVQQIREGRNDFFVTFVEVLFEPENPEAATRLPTGDFLHGFLHGTRAALTENGRESMTLTLDKLDAHRLGTLIALFERAVGLYAELIDINAYHQPGVEAGKKAAKRLLALQERVVEMLTASHGTSQTALEMAQALNEPESVENIFHILRRLAANHLHGVRAEPGTDIFESKFRIIV
jgi:glucose-6-phosphate isomerase